jgi:hypothetical protein
MHLVSGEPPEASEALEEQREKEKPSYRSSLIVASSSLILLGLVLVMTPLKGRMTPQGMGEREPNQFRLQPSVPVQRDKDFFQDIEEKQQKTETTHHRTLGSNPPFTQKKHYAVQVGAFRNWENASQRMDALRKKDLEPYWVEIRSKSRSIIYIVFSGYFGDRNEAIDFLKHEGILNNYPDSYVREISFQKK